MQETPSPRSPEMDIRDVRDVMHEPEVVVQETYEVAAIPQSNLSPLQTGPPIPGPPGGEIKKVVPLDTYKVKLRLSMIRVLN